MAVPEFLWPKVAVQPRPATPAAERYVRSYLIMRVAIGALGFAIPPVLVLVEPLLFDFRPFPRGSLSAYYYSGLREVFVGSLCAIGVFLITYKVAERSRENRLSTYAGIFVILVALFPTGRPGAKVPATPLQDLLGETWVERIHFGAAALFISSLAVISYYFSRPPRDPPEDEADAKRRALWKKYHLTCVGLIVAALIVAALAGITGWPNKGLLIAEWLAVWAFAASWFAKGFEIRRLLRPRAAPAAAVQ